MSDLTRRAALSGLAGTAFASAAAAAVAQPATRAGRGPSTFPYTDFGPAGQVAARERVDDLNVTFVRFANGVQLIVKPTDFAANHILVRARIGNGLLDLPSDRLSAVNTLGPGVIEGGLADLTADQVTRAIGGRNVSASFAVQPGGFVQLGVTGQGNFDLQMQLLCAYVAKPGWRTDTLAANAAINAALFERAANSPDALLRQQAPLLLHDGDQRFREADGRALSTMKAADLKATLEPVLARGSIEVVIVGDITVERAIDMTARTYGALPPRDERQTPAGSRSTHFPAPTPRPVTLRHKGAGDQALVMTAWPTGGYSSRTQAPQWRFLAMILAARLGAAVKAGQVVANAISEDMSETDTFPDYGYVAVQAHTGPAHADAVLAALDDIAADLAARGPAADELEAIRALRIDQLTRQMRMNSYWMVALAGSAGNRRLLQDQRDIMPNLRVVTAAALRTAAADTLNKDSAWRLAILPEAATIAANG